MTGRARALISAATAVLAVATNAFGAQQPTIPAPLGASTERLSSTVVGVVIKRGFDTFLIVLWRGAPGWSSVPGQGMFSGSGGAMSSGTAPYIWVMLKYGALELNFSYDETRPQATVQGVDVQLHKGVNVILVDHVDTPELSVTGVLAIETKPDGPSPTLASILGRSPEAVAFLQCDVRTNPRFNSTVCDQLKK